MLNKKEKKINQIQIGTRELSGIYRGRCSFLYSDFPCGSTVTATCTIVWSDGTTSSSAYPSFVSIPVGETKSEEFCLTYSNASIESPVQISGSFIDSIDNISPSEDDTYIYTF